MLTFLRKIRKSLIDTGSARKYMLYAVGEILLVMIGILLALQINNWNDRMHDEAFFIEMLGEIKTDLKRDTFRFNRASEGLQKSIQYKMLGLEKKEFRFEDLDSIPYYIYPIRYEWEITDHGFRRLIRTEFNLPKKYRNIYNEMDRLYNVINHSNIELINNKNSFDQMSDQYFLNQSIFEIDTGTEYPMLQDPKEKFINIQSFLADPNTRNLIKVDILMMEDLLRQTERVKKTTIELLEMIKEHLPE